MYFGEYERTVDYKGRLTLPGHVLQPSDSVDWSAAMVLRADQPALFVYDVKTWKNVLDEAYVNMDDDEARLFMHRVLADAQPSDIDSLKRITVPAPLLEYAGIEKRATVVGMFNRLEIWDPDRWKSYLETLEDVAIPSLADLSRARIRQVS